MNQPRYRFLRTAGNILLALSLPFLHVQSGRAAIVSDAVAIGNYDGAPVVSNRKSRSIDVEPARPLFEMAVTGLLDDQDGDGLGDLGEKVNYTFTFKNTGNLTLKNLRVREQLSGISDIICTGDEDGDGDIDVLLPLASGACSTSYVIAQSDLLQKSIDTLATSGATSVDGNSVVKEDDSGNDNITAILIDQIDELKLRNTATAPALVFPNIYEIDYRIEIENAGTIIQSQLRLSDDLLAAVSNPGRLISTSVIEMKNFIGTGTINGNFDGINDVQVFSGDVQLVPGKTGIVRIRVRIDTASKPFLSLNTAYVSSATLVNPIPSDDPSETPEDVTDANPAETLIFDSDTDGVGNEAESDVADSDKDGTPDIDDYDPTGHLYCETDGRILFGGQIAIQNLATSGIQSGTGHSNDITIVKDGSDGQYQFYVSKAGTYRLSMAALPMGAPLSSQRLPGPPLDARLDLPVDASGLPPTNSVRLGSSINSNSPVLTDASAPANPYYLDFKLVEFDPVIFNNNIPFAQCTNPALAVTAAIIKGPAQMEDGSSIVTYRVSVENTGTHYAKDFQISDPLAAIFGEGNYSIRAIEFDSNLEVPGATLNPVFDGSTSSNLFVSGTRLGAGESISILLEIQINVPAGIYTNQINVGGANPFNGDVIKPAKAAVTTEILRPDEQKLAVSAIAGTVDMKLGHQFLLTVAIKNPETFARDDGEIVALIPEGFSYVPGTSKLNGVAGEPEILGRELVWKARRFPAGELALVQIALRLDGEVSDQKFITSAHVRQKQTGELISNPAKVAVSLAVEPLFKCSDIIGRVFHDLNGNGKLDTGEKGLAGIGLETVSGLHLITDGVGRFQVACSAIPDGQIGADFDMKLDETSLPANFHLTSENPVVVSLTLGGLTKINFGATQLREIQLGLQGQSFSGDTIRLTPTALGRVAQLLTILEEKPSVLMVVYAISEGDAADKNLANLRLQAVKTLLDAAWASGPAPYKLAVKTEIK